MMYFNFPRKPKTLISCKVPTAGY